METITDIFFNILNQFTNPKKRVFVFYIFLSIVIATLWLMFRKKKSFKKAIKIIFNPKLLFSKSATSDYKVFLINQIIMFLVSPVLLTQLTIATALYYYFHTIHWLSSGMYSHLPTYLIVSLFTIFHFKCFQDTKLLMHF